MKELTKNELRQINGGIFSLFERFVSGLVMPFCNNEGEELEGQCY